MKTCLRIFSIVCLVGGLSVPVFGKYVLSTDGDWQYSGTGSHWVDDGESETGKVIRDCTVTLTDHGLSINGGTDGNLTLDGATVVYKPDIANGSQPVSLGTYSSNATLTLNNGSRFYWDTDDDWNPATGGGYSYASVGGSGYTATINVNDGSLLDMKRHYLGNHNASGSTTSVNLNVHGGMVCYTGSRSGLYLGWHNPITMTISDGGLVSSNTTILIADSGGSARNNASTVAIIGDSALTAKGMIRFGQYVYGPTKISFLADNSGLGKMSSSVNIDKREYGTVVLGIDHALAVMDDKAYQVISSTGISNWTDITTGLWVTSQSGGNVTATLNPTLKQGDEDFKLVIGERVDVTDSLATRGWTEITASETYALMLELDGLDGMTALQEFVDWYNTSDNDSKAVALTDNLVSLSNFAAGNGFFAWDFSEYTKANVGLGNIGVAVAPEPAAWLLLLCGLLGQNFLRRKGNKR
ncbi:MAG: hypothetical protein Q4D98_08030 [Planctomycetia bacterium]|nr:hypothetical protein [Planctomycetia bacterium]